MKKWIIIVVILGMVAWAGYDFIGKESVPAEEVEAEVGLEQGNIAPDFELETVGGETVKLSDFRGEKVLLNFWATWCPPCRAEMPDMQKFHEKNEDGVILAVNLRETENSSRNVYEFLEEYGITFQVLSDAETKVANTYKAQALPTSYLIDTEGKIQNVAIGPLNYESMVKAFAEMN
jgi:peroxiredoxin